jgi:hypothetical protein
MAQPAAEPKKEPQPAEPTLIFPSRSPALKAQTAPASAPATRTVVPVSRPTAAKTPRPGALQKSVKSAGNILGNTAAWFAALSIGAKLRLLLILLLVIWICGISVPFALITFLDGGLGNIVPIGAVQPPDPTPLAVAVPLECWNLPQVANLREARSVSEGVP